MDRPDLDKFPKLRKRIIGTGRITDPDKLWTIENLRQGLMYFYSLYNKYPTSHEIDSFEYLPSSRQIQRRFGGLVELRKAVGLGPNDFTRGRVRAVVAGEADRRARLQEEEYYKLLTQIVPEVRVHEQKVIRPQGIRCDFFIYTSKNKGLILDIFYAKDTFSFASHLIIKLKKYGSCDMPIILVVMGEHLTQEEIDKIVANKKSALTRTIRVLSDETFRRELPMLIKSAEAETH